LCVASQAPTSRTAICHQQCMIECCGEIDSLRGAPSLFALFHACELMSRVGQNHIYTVYIRYFWQGNHQIYGHTRCIYTVLANPTYESNIQWLGLKIFSGQPVPYIPKHALALVTSLRLVDMTFHVGPYELKPQVSWKVHVSYQCTSMCVA
jgi:hypothetical protein